MNYLGHFVFNHDVRRRQPEPYFVMGVALPDLWPRFSRRRRISWRAVRGRQPPGQVDTALRAGLLNHVQVDQHFHALPTFLRWQQALKAGVVEECPHSMMADFLTHVAIELVLDQQLVRTDDELVERFYGCLEACDLPLVERRVAALGHVDAAGLHEVIQGFLGRRFLHRYRSHGGLLIALQRVLELTTVPVPAKRRMIEGLLEHAAALIDPQQVWAELMSPCPAAAAR